MLVAVLFLCGLTSYWIAGRKGRFGQKWFWVGVLFGPIGVVVALVVVPDAFTKADREGD